MTSYEPDINQNFIFIIFISLVVIIFYLIHKLTDQEDKIYSYTVEYANNNKKYLDLCIKNEDIENKIFKREKDILQLIKENKVLRKKLRRNGKFLNVIPEEIGKKGQ